MSYAGLGQLLADIGARMTGVVVSPTPSRVVVAPARPSSPIVVTLPPRPSGGAVVVTRAPAADAITAAAIAKANVDRAFRAYAATSYTDAARRNSARQALLAAGREMIRKFMAVRPATETERLRLRALEATALASSQTRQRCFGTGSNGCGRFGANEPAGPVKVNDEFVAVTRPLTNLLRLNAVPITPPLHRAPPLVVAGRLIQTISPRAAQLVVDSAKSGTATAAAKLEADVKVSQEVTKPETKVAADKVVVAQAGADAAAKAAEDLAMKAKMAAEEADKVAQAAKEAGTIAAAQAAATAAQAAEQAKVVAEQATVAAAEVATVADEARSELETVAAETNDVPAQEATTEATMTVATTGQGPLGISWKIWGLGAAALVGGYLFMNSRGMAKNRRVRRNRRRR